MIKYSTNYTFYVLFFKSLKLIYLRLHSNSKWSISTAFFIRFLLFLVAKIYVSNIDEYVNQYGHSNKIIDCW